MLLLIIFLSFFAFLSHYDPLRHNVFEKLHPPSLKHPCGTDSLGRDVLTRLMYAGRISLLVGITTALISLGIGVPIGLIAGYYGGRIDGVLMRVTDMFLSFPTLFVLILVSALLRETGITTLSGGQPFVIAATIGILSWMTIARLVRVSTLSLRDREFILAARSLGNREYRIIVSHIFPNTLSPVIVEATLLVGWAILSEAGLSFIGFGIHPRIPTWGNMLREGQQYFLQYPWLAIFPGLLVFFTVISINYIGDGLRDILDPKDNIKK